MGLDIIQGLCSSPHLYSKNRNRSDHLNNAWGIIMIYTIKIQYKNIHLNRILLLVFIFSID